MVFATRSGGEMRWGEAVGEGTGRSVLGERRCAVCVKVKRRAAAVAVVVVVAMATAAVGPSNFTNNQD